MPSLVSIPPNIMTAALDTISAGRERGRRAGSTPFPCSIVPPTWRASAATPLGASGPISPPTDTRSTAATISSYQPEHDRGLGIDQLERTGHPHGERAGEVAPDLGPTGGARSSTSRACLELDRRRCSGLHLGLAKAPGERVAMASVLVAVERQHARPDDLCGGEARIVDREAGGVAHDLDAQVPARDQPAVEDGQPRDRLTLAEARERGVRIHVELSSVIAAPSGKRPSTAVTVSDDGRCRTADEP